MNINMTQDLQHSTNIWSLKELLSLCCIRALGLGLVGHACDETTLELPDTLLGRLCSFGTLCFFLGGALGLTALVFAALGVGLGVTALLPMISTMGMGLSMHQQQHHKTNAKNPAHNQNVASTLEHLQYTTLCEAPQRSSTRYSMQGAGTWLDGCMATSSSLAQNE